MPLYKFVCCHCHAQAESTASNARFCSKKECQKARKDVNRQQYKDRKKTELPTQNIGSAQEEQISVVAPKPIVNSASCPAEAKAPPKTKAPQKGNGFAHLSGPNVERVDDNIIIIRTYNVNRPSSSFSSEKK